LILLVALLFGLIAGLILALYQKRVWQPPPLRTLWLVVIAFLPQIFFFYLPATRSKIPTVVVAAGLILSQAVLLVFCWLNRRLPGIWLLALGLVLNLLVISANGGFMPISPQTAAALLPANVLARLQVGGRFGYGKDILLTAGQTKLAWLADRFLLPAWSPYQVAFSLGDILVACGAFWLLFTQGKPLTRRSSKG
jgi:hypothetical protein